MVGDGFTIKTSTLPVDLGATITKDPDRLIQAGEDVTVTLTAPASQVYATDGKTYYFKDWTLGGGMITTDLTNGTKITDRSIKFTQPQNNDWTAVANYNLIPVPASGTVTVGSVVWSKVNLAADGSWASSETDAGGLFLWGTKEGVAGWPDTATRAYTSTFNATTPYANDPCPTGWRLPLYSEFESMKTTLKNYVQSGGTTNGQMGSWGTGDATLRFVVGGYRNASGAWQNGELSHTATTAYHFSDTSSSTLGGNVYVESWWFYDPKRLLEGRAGGSIRCVRDAN